MKKQTTIILIGVFLAIISITNAQDIAEIKKEIEELKKQDQALQKKINSQKPGKNQFRMTGFANITYHQGLDDFDDSRFDHTGFSPIMIWKPSEKLFFESELHIELEGGTHGGETGEGHGQGGGGHGSGEDDISHGGSTHFDMGYTNIGYFLNDYITITGGKFLSPFGLFNERLHPSWINKLPSDPLGFGHGGATPITELGVQIRGGLPVRKSKLNYALYISNGPVLEDGKGDPERAGALVYSNFKDNNANKAIGGRIGFLPLSNSSLEIGFSGQQVAKTGDKGTQYEDIGAILYGADLTYVKDFSAIKGNIQLLGQLSVIDVEDAEYARDTMDINMDLSNALTAEDSSNVSTVYTFKNHSTLYYVQLAYRPSKSGKKLLQNLEFVFRYDAADIANGAKWEFSDSRMTFGLNYWLYSRSTIKLAVQVGKSDNIMLLQWAIGF